MAEQLLATTFKVSITALSILVVVVPRGQGRERATQRTIREVLEVRESAWSGKVNKGGLSSPRAGFSPMETFWSTRDWRWGRREIQRRHFPGSVSRSKISRDCNERPRGPQMPLITASSMAYKERHEIDRNCGFGNGGKWPGSSMLKMAAVYLALTYK